MQGLIVTKYQISDFCWYHLIQYLFKWNLAPSICTASKTQTQLPSGMQLIAAKQTNSLLECHCCNVKQIYHLPLSPKAEQGKGTFIVLCIDRWFLCREVLLVFLCSTSLMGLLNSSSKSEVRSFGGKSVREESLELKQQV